MPKRRTAIGAVLDLIMLALLLYFLFRIYQTGFFNSFIGSIASNISSTSVPTTVAAQGANGTQSFTTIPSNSSQASIFSSYVLGLINKDRGQYGLKNVTLSNMSSAQQHAISMLQYGYFSHWDVYGLKPYMRYTLLGGNGSVTENVAYETRSACIAFICSGNIDPKNALAQMEYNMMYNDSACCNNGHRNNILDPYHNQVSIGVAYNSSTVYLVEDFIDSYVLWNSSSPSFSNGEAYLSGNLSGQYSLSSITVSYDQPLSNMSKAQLAATSEYDYGNQIAGVVANSRYYYRNLTTIVAGTYLVGGQNFDIKFNMDKLISSYGAGEYTILVWMAPKGSPSSSFVGSTYTVFIGSNGKAYLPSGV